MSADSDVHYTLVCQQLAKTRVVIFLGAGVNRCGRPPAWEPGHTLPDGGELATHLAAEAGYPGSDKENLLRVAQYYLAMLGSGDLYEKLHTLFDVDCSPTPVHEFLAWLPSALREQGSSDDFPLIVTTNYDDALERAFDEAGEPFDVLVYEVEPRGRLIHYPPGGEGRPIPEPNKSGVSTRERPVVLKMHGAINRRDSGGDSYVIAEDDYIDYLTHADLPSLVPVTLSEKLTRSHFLFLGYSMRDWNMRVVLQRIWDQQKHTYESWAVQLDPQLWDKKLWDRRSVEIFDIRLEEYIAELRAHLRGEPTAGSE